MMKCALFVACCSLTLSSLVGAQTTTQFDRIARSPFPADTMNTASLAVGDYNFDGAPDILYVDFTVSNQVHLYKNDGRGGFTDVTSTTLPQLGSARAWRVSFIRADRDPFLDIVIAMTNGANVLLMNQRNGTFKDESSTRLPSLAVSTSYGLAIGDVDADGDTDIVFGSTTTQNVLLLNDGLGKFSNATSNMPVGSLGAWGAELADVDGDKDLDLLFANSSLKQQQLYINDGKGVFKDETATRLPTLSTTSRVVRAGDVDGDGDLDLYYANYRQQDVLLINNGKGVFRDETAMRLPVFTVGSYGARMVDLDEDKDLDIIVGSFTNPMTLLLNDGKGQFSDQTLRLSNNPISALDVVAVDVDRDRDLDLVYAAWGASNGIAFNHEGQISAAAPPKINSTWKLDAYAQPGYGTLPQAGVVLLGSGPLAARPLTQWGYLGIAPPWYVISSWSVPPMRSGRATISLPLPNDNKLVGIKLWWQGFHLHTPIDTRLMNVWFETIE